MTDQQYKECVTKAIAHYKNMEQFGSSMIHEVKWQYADMANGGRAHDGLNTYLRDEYYQGYPDDFFMQVLSCLGEFDRYTTIAMEKA